MKFCKNLQRVAKITDPAWAPFFFNYKQLKKVVKALPTSDDDITLLPVDEDELQEQLQNESLNLSLSMLYDRVRCQEDDIIDNSDNSSYQCNVNVDEDGKFVFVDNHNNESSTNGNHEDYQQRVVDASSVVVGEEGIGCRNTIAATAASPSHQRLPTLRKRRLTKVTADKATSSSACTLSSLSSEQQQQQQHSQQQQLCSRKCCSKRRRSRHRIRLGQNRAEIAFFRLLLEEFHKASQFFEKVQQECLIRQDVIMDGMKILKQRQGFPLSCRQSQWSYMARSIYRLRCDLVLLETFSIMTVFAFSKILKKHDKLTRFETRSAFMESIIVPKANFCSYPRILEMIQNLERLYEMACQEISTQHSHSTMNHHHHHAILPPPPFPLQVVNGSVEESSGGGGKGETGRDGGEDEDQALFLHMVNRWRPGMVSESTSSTPTTTSSSNARATAIAAIATSHYFSRPSSPSSVSPQQRSKNTATSKVAGAAESGKSS